MQVSEGSGSHELGPSEVSAREALRRGLYAPGARPEALQAYLDLGAVAVDDEARGDDSAGPSMAAETPGPRRGRRLALAVSGVVAVLALGGLAWAWLLQSTALPERVSPPAALGRTLLYYSRVANPQSAPDKVTFEPADESVLFRADGHVLDVVLACVGEGSVRITAAEHDYEFACDGRLRTLSRRSNGPVHGYFTIFGRTTGNVVWGLRLTSLPVGG